MVPFLIVQASFLLVIYGILQILQDVERSSTYKVNNYPMVHIYLQRYLGVVKQYFFIFRIQYDIINNVFHVCPCLILEYIMSRLLLIPSLREILLVALFTFTIITQKIDMELRKPIDILVHLCFPSGIKKAIIYLLLGCKSTC